jgi:hypothetical protein
VPIDDEAEFRALMGGTTAAVPSDQVYNPDRPSSWGAEGDPSYVRRGERLVADARALPSLDSEINAYDAEEDAQIERNLGQQDVGTVSALRAGLHDSERDAARSALLQTVTTPGHPNPLRPIREDQAMALLGDGSTTTELDASGNVIERPTGLLNDEAYYTQQLQGAQVEEQRAHAAAYATEATRQQARIDVMERKAEADTIRRQEALKAEQVVMAKLSAAADRLNEAPDIDPNRYWASQSAGRKALWAIQAALAGFAGLDPLGALNSAIAMDIDAQKANFAQKQAGFNARVEEFGAARSVYADLREGINDEMTADLMMESARLQQAEVAFKAMAVKEGIPPAMAQANIFLTQLQQRNVEIWTAIRERLAMTPAIIGGGTRPLYTGPIRKTLEQIATQENTRGQATELAAIEQGGKAASAATEFGQKKELAQIEADAKVRAAEATERGKGDAEIQKNTREWGTVETMIDDFLAANPDDIAGVGIPLTGSRGERISTAVFQRMLTNNLIKAITGANFSEQQGKDVLRIVEGTWDEFSDDDMRARLRALKQIVSAQRKYMQRPLQAPSRQVESVDQFSTFKPE